MAEHPDTHSDEEWSEEEDDHAEDGDEVDGGGSFLPPWLSTVQEKARSRLYTTMGDILAWHVKPSQENPPKATGRLTGGPKRKAAVAIIGGGPAGVHMAYMLKKMRGFDIDNITIFEKTERIGGKSRSVYHRGAVHEMGTCYMESPDYEQVKQLLEEFNAGEEAEIGGSLLWDPENTDKDIPFKEWLFQEVAKSMGRPSIGQLHCAWEVFRQSFEYANLHRKLLGEYSGFLMPRPNEESFKMLDMSIAEFLDQNGLNALKPIFLLLFTCQGYGFLEKTSALYGLLWVTPNMLVGLVEQAKVRKALSHAELRKRPVGARRTVTTLVHGFERLWQTMVEKIGVRVLRKANITAIRRDIQGSHITYALSPGEQHQESFDFLVVAAPIQAVLPALDAHEDEIRIFSKVQADTFVTTLFDYKPARAQSAPAMDNWLCFVRPDPEWSVWGLRDTHHVLRQSSCPVKLDNPDIGTAVSYQYANRQATEKDEKKIAERHATHFTRHGLRDIKVIHREMWSYFPKYGIRDMSKGMLWDILELQGKYGTWYTGAWAIFESLKAIVDYNKMLVEVWGAQ